MESTNAWDRFSARRRSRRGVLRGGVTSLAGLALAGCATATVPPTAAPTTAAPAGPTTAAGPAAGATAGRPAPKLGGMLRSISMSSEPNLEPHSTPGIVSAALGAQICYSTLLTYKWGPDVK